MIGNKEQIKQELENIKDNKKLYRFEPYKEKKKQ